MHSFMTILTEGYTVIDLRLVSCEQMVVNPMMAGEFSPVITGSATGHTLMSVPLLNNSLYIHLESLGANVIAVFKVFLVTFLNLVRL